jgi:putative ABC transport system permease protein
LGFLIAFWSNDLLKILLPDDLPRAAGIGVDAGVMAFALAVSAAAGLLFGLLPAWRATRMNVHDAVKAGSRTHTAGRGARLLQSGLVISEVCLSLALLAGAGLLANSFLRVRSVQPGFRTDRVLTAEVYFAYPKNDAEVLQLRSKYRDLLARVRALPGVEYAGTASSLPLTGAPDGMFDMERSANLRDKPDAEYVVISAGYLRALHIPIVSGRDFTAADSSTAAGVAIVNADMARRFWPDRSPLGERIWFKSFESREHWLTIVGVAADVREDGLTQPVAPLAYVCDQQASRLAAANLLIRTRVDPSSLAAPVRAALRAVDPEATSTFTTMERTLAESLSHQRFQMQVLAGFAGLALLLAAVGLYGVLSYMVTASRPEIGVRMALGAPPAAVFRMVARRALGLATAGAAAGLVGFLALRQVLAKLLFGVGPGDPATLAGATAVLLIVALFAACLPARRAMKVDPVAALREE